MMATKGHVISQLLQGTFICRTSDEESWRYLKNPAQREHVDSYLSELNRIVATVGTGTDSEVFFCGYLQLGEAERKVISSQFKDICQALMPMAELLVLLQEAGAQDAPLTEGVAVRLNELQTIIEDTPACREQLAKISHFRLFGSTSNNVDSQLKLVFRRLCELGYLLRPNPEKQIYIATGKIDYLYEVIRFIDETEALDLEAHADLANQGQLL